MRRGYLHLTSIYICSLDIASGVSVPVRGHGKFPAVFIQYLPVFNKRTYQLFPSLFCLDIKCFAESVAHCVPINNKRPWAITSCQHWHDQHTSYCWAVKGGNFSQLKYHWAIQESSETRNSDFESRCNLIIHIFLLENLENERQRFRTFSRQRLGCNIKVYLRIWTMWVWRPASCLHCTRTWSN